MSQTTIRSIIVDDDPFIRDLLQDKLKQYVPEVEIIDVAVSGAEGVEKILRWKPDLIFLDVEMTDMTGFEMLAKLEEVYFETIFITSYSHYAIKAIRFNALDYLVKPIDLGELKMAIRRYQKRMAQKRPMNKIQQALANLRAPSSGAKQLILMTQEGEVRLPLGSIIRVEGERNYSCIYLVGGKKKLTTKTLSDLEEMLSDDDFFRCHKSHLVNAAHISRQPTSVSLVLSDSTELPIARRKKEDFRRWKEEVLRTTS